MADRPKTILQKIVDALYLRFEAMKDDENEGLWNNLTSGSPSGLSASQYPAIGLEQSQEEITDMTYPYILKKVTFFAEFRFVGRGDVDSSDEFRYYLGKLQATLFGDTDKITLGGIADNVQEVGSNPEIEGSTDTSPGGVLIFDVQYRHINGDPYTR